MAVTALLARINAAIQRFDFVIASLLTKRFPPDGLLAAVALEGPFQPNQNDSFTLKDIVGNGFLWAVPTSRRTIEKRHKRRYGDPEYYSVMLRPKTNIKTCNTCGDDHVAGYLCPTCYKKVIDETKAMQDAIQAELKLEPVEKEVVVLYEGEKNDKPDEFWQGKRVVEMQKPRPNWFSKNLLQETTQQPATTTDVKPSDLG